jgi:iron(III)-salmochelin esterase
VRDPQPGVASLRAVARAGRTALLAAAACSVAACRSTGVTESAEEAPGAVSFASVSTSPPITPRAPTPGALREHTWDFDDGPFGPTRVVVAVPAEATPERRRPVLVAFHGRGEARKGVARGARGWLDDYALGAAIEHLHAGVLSRADFHGFVTDERLAYWNARLAARAYAGLIVVCPYLPDVLRGARAFHQGEALAAFIAERVLPRVYRETPALPRAAVDGVSLGGRAALLVGLLRPESFISVGALQPAIDDAERGRWVSLAREARARNPRLALRLLTSDEDYFLAPTRHLGRALSEAGVRAAVDVVTGPHDYEFNRGPGAFEMLLHHEAVLASGDPG